MNANATAMMTARALRSRGLGMFACAAFGAFWASTALSMWPVTAAAIGYGVTALMTGGLLVAAIRMIRRSRQLSSADAAMSSRQRRTGTIFFAIFAAEIIAMNIAAYLLASHHLMPYLMPVIAIIVGLHFYPLASLFRASRYYVTASVMTLAGVAGAVAIASGVAANPVNATVEIVCAITLWSTGVVSWRTAN